MKNAFLHMLLFAMLVWAAMPFLASAEERRFQVNRTVRSVDPQNEGHELFETTDQISAALAQATGEAPSEDDTGLPSTSFRVSDIFAVNLLSGGLARATLEKCLRFADNANEKVCLNFSSATVASFNLTSAGLNNSFGASYRMKIADSGEARSYLFVNPEHVANFGVASEGFKASAQPNLNLGVAFE